MNGLQEVVNFMIPAIGGPRCYIQSQVFDPAVAVPINFIGITGGYWDGQPFRPSGVFIDNTQGTAPLIVIINELSYRMACPAGHSLNLSFPAPPDLTATITGEGQATVVFVDIPVMPYRSF